MKLLREIREEFQRPIHQGTNNALVIAWLSGLIGGGVAVSGAMAVGGVIAGVGALASVWYAPAADQVAIEWREHQRLVDDDGGDRDV